MEHGRVLILDFYRHYKYYHFYSICFGLGCGTALYSPYRAVTLPLLPAVFCTVVFEVVGAVLEMPAHTKACKGRPYDRGDLFWGFGLAIFVAYLNLKSYHVYTQSYGCGIMVFAVSGAIRKYRSLRRRRERRRSWW